MECSTDVKRSQRFALIILKVFLLMSWIYLNLKLYQPAILKLSFDVCKSDLLLL